ncbi:hypothetical protein DPMN_155774 [Dreissena polymorpha]|uniref:Uncharacterized protein n=1 Tax=Dreissena polymorpha TaxID=45954 RepID=A0A9D4FNJ6_DREPO|nr:hypothetical protein DPMN_155774 [Dreissena polymorpha]
MLLSQTLVKTDLSKYALQGLPLDHSVTELWHLSECDTSANCFCKTQEKLQKEDVEGALLQLQPDEHRAQDQFSRLMTFGSNRLLKKLSGMHILCTAMNICKFYCHLP